MPGGFQVAAGHMALQIESDVNDGFPIGLPAQQVGRGVVRVAEWYHLLKQTVRQLGFTVRFAGPVV